MPMRGRAGTRAISSACCSTGMGRNRRAMRLFVFGLGYTASRLAAALTVRDWRVAGVGRDDFSDRERVAFEVRQATHILSSVPPGEDDPVLAAYGDVLAGTRAWLGYLS